MSGPTTDGAPPPEKLSGAYARLFERGYAFDFFQATYLLERLFGEVDASPSQRARAERDRIAFRPSATRAFPASDVRRIERTASGARVVATFMGLYGPNAAAPGGLHDRIDDADERTHALRDFLDIFNHRLLAYAYRAWKKVRPELFVGAAAQSAQDRFAAVAGLALALGALRAPQPDGEALSDALIGFAGRLSSPARNPSGLCAIVEAQLGVAARVQEHVPRWIRIEERPLMGGGRPFRLGTGAPMGRRVRDCSGKFRLVLGPLRLSDYEALLPGGPLARRVAALVRLYVPDALAYDVELDLDTSEAGPAHLGDARSRMGATAFLGTPRGPSHARIVEYG